MDLKLTALLLELKRGIEGADWVTQPASELEAKGARAFAGIGDGWSFLVVSFDGGAAGTATRTSAGEVVFLPPELAKRAAEIALSQATR